MSTETKAAASEIKSVLVVDDDEVARNLIVNYLKRLGHRDIDQREDGEAAWAAIKGPKRYDLIVLDWKLPRLSGLALFNRIRSRKGYKTTPLLVVSGFLAKNDFRLLQEFPCTALMEKPFTNGLFENRVAELRRECEWYGQNVALIDGVLQAVEHDEKKAETLIKQVLKKAPNPIPLALLAARRLGKAGLYKSAEKVLRGVLAIDDGSVIAMNELGKTLHLSGRHKQAVDVLRQANKISPQSMQRLCLLGEAELNLQDPEAAGAYFEQALAIDAEDPVAKAGTTVAENMLEQQQWAGSPAAAAGVQGSFASLMNTLGVTYVRSGQYQRGIEQYRAAMSFLRSRGDSARVAFNLGLGYLRWGKPADALPWFQKSERMADAGFAKSARYVARLLSADNGLAKAALAVEAIVDAPRRPAPAAVPLPALETEVDSPASPGGGAEVDDSNVIPFPVAAEPAGGGDDDMLEETVGSDEMVLRRREAAAATLSARSAAEDLDDGGLRGEPSDDELLDAGRDELMAL